MRKQIFFSTGVAIAIITSFFAGVYISAYVVDARHFTARHNLILALYGMIKSNDTDTALRVMEQQITQNIDCFANNRSASAFALYKSYFTLEHLQHTRLNSEMSIAVTQSCIDKYSLPLDPKATTQLATINSKMRAKYVRP